VRFDGRARVTGRARLPLDERGTPVRGEAGYSLAELLVCLAILGLCGAWSVLRMTSAEEHWRERGAARLVAGALARARFEAVSRGASVAVQFVDERPGLSYRLVADMNANGVRNAEVADGSDVVIAPAVRVQDEFRGIRLAVAGPCPGIDGADAVDEASEPLRFGDSGLAVFTPRGTATSGTIYLSGEGRVTFAVRVLGTTGRTRVLWCPAGGQGWEDL
jgi:prepilin-type N-terminal cleavage/methylation domain-containing protein